MNLMSGTMMSHLNTMTILMDPETYRSKKNCYSWVESLLFFLDHNKIQGLRTITFSLLH